MKVMTAAVLGLATAAALTGTPAQAARAERSVQQTQCVTHHEFLSISRGMTRHEVGTVFGDRKSSPYSGGANGYVRSYKSCDMHHAALIRYVIKVKKMNGRKFYFATFEGGRRWVPAS